MGVKYLSVDEALEMKGRYVRLFRTADGEAVLKNLKESFDPSYVSMTADAEHTNKVMIALGNKEVIDHIERYINMEIDNGFERPKIG